MSHAHGAMYAQPQPLITFHPPDPRGHIIASNSENLEIARFAVSKGTITRLLGATQNVVCTFKRSSLSGTTTLHVHGQEVKVRAPWDGIRSGKDISAPGGPLELRKKNGEEEIRDARGVVVARGGTGGLMVSTVGDEFFMDMLLSVWIAGMEDKKAEKDELKAVGKVFEAVLGAG